KPVKTEVPAINVKTAVISEKEIAFPVHSSGKLSFKEEIKLSFKTGGIIKKIHVDEGQTVKKGSLLAELDLREINASVKQAELAVKKAERDYSRVKNLYNDSVATLEQLQNVTTALDYAISNMEIAGFNKKHSVIRAPENGIISKRMAENNEMIGQAYPVFLFASTENYWVVRVNITDKDVLKMQYNDTANVIFDAYKNHVFKSTICEIGSYADPYTGTYEIELKLKKTKFPLVSGLIGSVNIIPSKTEKFLQIPFEAMIEGNQNEAYIYVLTKNNKHEKVRLKIEGMDSEYFFVKSGIEAGSTVITDGSAYLKANSKIEIIK
ncbi:efflux RND transporter periplasmic adaptor subunit, partial [Bacteroidota bacterium]